MPNLNDLEDVTISDPRAGDVIKYTATGWVNGADATGTPPGGNPCGTMDGYTRDDREETITEKWTWENAGCPSIEVKHIPSGQSSYICPDKFQTQGNNVTGVFGLDGSNVKVQAAGGRLRFSDDEVTTPVTLGELVGCCDNNGNTGVTQIIAGNGISISPTSGTGAVTVTSLATDPENPGIYPTRFLNFGRTTSTPYDSSVQNEGVPDFAQQTENIADLPAAVKKYILTFEVGATLKNYGTGAGTYGRIQIQWDVTTSDGTLTPNNRTALNLITNNPEASLRDEHLSTGRSSKSSVLDLGDDWAGGNLNVTVNIGYKKLAKAGADIGHGRVVLTPVPPNLTGPQEAAFISSYITVPDDDTDSIFDEPVTPEMVNQDDDISNKEYLKLAVLATTGAYLFGNYDQTVKDQLQTVGGQLYALQAQNDIDQHQVRDTINSIVEPVRPYLIFSWDYYPTANTTYMF